MKRTFTSATALALASNVAAFWRMPCRTTTGIARIDPLVSPGDLADHAHIVFGGGNFGMNSSYEKLVNCPEKEYDCSSCAVTQDKSAYWTPPLYFQHANGQVEMVENVGGMLAYYLFYLDDVQPFPEGFQMIAGYPSYRNFTGPFPDAPLSSWPTDPTDQFFLQQRAIGVNCLNYAKDPEPSLYRHQFPEKSWMDANCKDGLRLEMAFPSCGTGAKDSEDHRSHVAYPSLVKEGNCPKGYDVHYPFLFFETIFATQKFAGVDGKFILSTGDPVGTSYHADFMMGWDSSEFLGKAINTCTNQSGRIEDCPLFNIQSDADAAQCKFNMPEEVAGDDCTGPREGLPVGVPIQYGPGPATKYPVIGAKGAPAPTSVPSNDIPKPKPSAPAQAPASAPAYTPVVKPSTTAAPVASPSKPNAECITTYVTKGNEVWEYVIEQVDVTMVTTYTATASGPAAQSTASSSAPSYGAPPSYAHKRHAEKHARHNRH